MSQLQSLEASVSPFYLRVYPQDGQSVVPCTHRYCSNILLLQLISTSHIVQAAPCSSLTRAYGEVSGREVGTVHGDAAVHAQLCQGSP